jgi:hypothetical protein
MYASTCSSIWATFGTRSSKAATASPGRRPACSPRVGLGKHRLDRRGEQAVLEVAGAVAAVPEERDGQRYQGKCRWRTIAALRPAWASAEPR